MSGDVVGLDTGRLEDVHAFVDELISGGHTTIIVLAVGDKTEEGEEARQYSFGSFGFCWFADRVFVAQRYIHRLMAWQDEMEEDLK